MGVMKKQCFKCKKIKDINLFYKHKRMSDGYLNKCIYCSLKDNKKRYYNPESRKRIIEYEKKRQQYPERRMKKLQYQRKSRKTNKGKNNCRIKLNNALRDKRIFKKPCQYENCGIMNVESHHPDYRSPLKVIWLCREHHLKIHGKNNF